MNTFDYFSENPREKTIDFCANKLPWLLAQRVFHGCVSQVGQDIFLVAGQRPNFLQQVRSSRCIKHFKGELV